MLIKPLIPLPLEAYLLLASLLFCIGVWGLINSRNAVRVLMSIELMLNAVNLTFIKASKLELKNVLSVNNDPLVSSDFNHDSHSSIVDLSLTKVVENKMAKVSAWYDNEWGFACRMCDLANYIGKI